MRPTSTQVLEVTAVRKLILIPLAALVFAAPVFAAPASATKAPLVIAMHDPGCHWFYLGGGPNHRKYATTVTRRGPVTLLNLDEATLKIKSLGGTKIDRVGAKLTLTAKGTYQITMVGQMPNDKTLTLKVT
jgi:hypothetical protein